MLQTLFYIPHFLFQGWLLAAWLVVAGLWLVRSYIKHKWSAETLSLIPIIVVVGVIIQFVLPILEVHGVDPDNPNGPLIPLGLAIRGYGTMVFLAMAAGLSLSVWRARQINFSVEHVVSICFWMIILGMIGARVFYVVEYWENFQAETLTAWLISIVDMTKGGIVVYGSLVGATAAAIIYTLLHRVPLLTFADVAAAPLAIGVGIGRIGCLLNGCCYGGVCAADLPAIEFPAGAPAYVRQIETGELFGMESDVAEADDGTKDPSRRKITSAAPGSAGYEMGFRAGDIYVADLDINDPLLIRAAIEEKLPVDRQVPIWRNDKKTVTMPIGEMPRSSARVHPTQIYSSINAFLIGGLLWFYFPFRQGNGEVFAVGIILYSITRFLLEFIRTDEYGVWGTPFSPSQYIGMGMIVVGMGVFTYARLRGFDDDAERNIKTAKPAASSA